MDPSGHSFRDADESNTCGIFEDCSSGAEIDELYQFEETYGCDSVSPTGLCMDASGEYIPNPVNDAAARDELKGWAAVGAVVTGAYAGVEVVPAAGRWILSKIVTALCVDGDCGNEVKALSNTVDPNKLEHIFGQTRHNLDVLVSFYGSETTAYNAVYDAFSSVAPNYSNAQLNRGIQIMVNGFNITVRGNMVDGVPKIGTFFIP